MPRYEPGQNQKIDEINRLVSSARHGDMNDMQMLLQMFHPMILKICKKWSRYFDDDSHNMKPWDILISDAQYWFMSYTLHTYTENGPATYNKFINDHLDQRIRYIFECELSYNKKCIFPDPDKHDPDGERDIFDDVLYKYARINNTDVSIEDGIVDAETTEHTKHVADMILSTVNDRRYFTQREAYIFIESTINGRTHDDISTELRISRTRVSQIIGKTRKKIRDQMEEKLRWWEINDYKLYRSTLPY